MREISESLKKILNACSKQNDWPSRNKKQQLADLTLSCL